MRLRFGGINARRIILSLARILAASAAMALVAWYLHATLHRLMGETHLAAAAQLLAGGTLGLAVFAGAALLLGSEEMQDLRALLRRR